VSAPVPGGFEQNQGSYVHFVRAKISAFFDYVVRAVLTSTVEKDVRMSLLKRIQRLNLLVLTFVCLCLFTYGPDARIVASELAVASHVTQGSLSFVENQGQWNESVLFGANADRIALSFGAGSITYSFSGDGVSQTGHEHTNRSKFKMRASLMDFNPEVQVLGRDDLGYEINYMCGNDASAWRTGLRSYREIVYRDIYPGIDMVFKGDSRCLKYDFVVAPGADVSEIGIRLDGVETISLDNDGNLKIRTVRGVLTEKQPVVYQVRDGEKTIVPCEYVVLSGNAFGFNMPAGYDESVTLTIDPVITYATFFGGSNTDLPQAMVLDDEGNVYVAGQTMSQDFPLVNAPDDIAVAWDAFVSKFSASGGLVWSTYLGGSDEDWAYGVAVDNNGNVAVAGWTDSPDFPVTAGALFPVYGGGLTDGFVAKLNPDGDNLVFSTFLGSEFIEEIHSVACGNDGSIFVAGGTESPTFPVTDGSVGVIFTGIRMAFVARFSPLGDSLMYSNILGGEGEETAHGLALDDDGCAYVTGITNSDNFPLVSALDESYGDGEMDAFILKLSEAGDTLRFSTYLGGENVDYATAIAVDSLGQCYVTGFTRSIDFPTNVFAYDRIQRGGRDAFITSLTRAGNGFNYSTYYGGRQNDIAHAIAVGDDQNVYITGSTQSSDFPRYNAIDEHLRGHTSAFVASLDQWGWRPNYSTYLGSDTIETGRAIALTSSGNAMVAGITWGVGFPTTPDGYDVVYNDNGDVFLVEITDSSCCQPPTVGDLDGECNGNICVTPTDLAILIDHLFISQLALDCLEEADIDWSDVIGPPSTFSVDSRDLTLMIDHLFISLQPLLPCP